MDALVEALSVTSWSYGAGRNSEHYQGRKANTTTWLQTVTYNSNLHAGSTGMIVTQMLWEEPTTFCLDLRPNS